MNQRALVKFSVCCLLAGLLAANPLPVLAQEKDDSSFESWEDDDQAKKPSSTPAPVADTAAVDLADTTVATSEADSGRGMLPAVSTRYGSVRLMGLFQTLFDTTLYSDNETVGFSFQRARIMLQGHLLSDELTYFFQGDAKNMGSFALDMYFKFQRGALSLRVGRFLPDYTMMMPRDESNLSAIRYPMLLTQGGFGVWRQIGVELGYQASDKFLLKLGVFNGLFTEPGATNPELTNQQMGGFELDGVFTATYADNNKAKDFLLKAAFNFSQQLRLDFNFWLGMPVNAADAGENDVVINAGPGIEYLAGKLHIMSEFLFRVVAYGTDQDAVTALGMWAHIGYFLSENTEAIFRADLVEPNLDADNDMRLRITGGGHYWIEREHLRLLINGFFELPIEGGDNAVAQEAIGLLVQASLAW